MASRPPPKAPQLQPAAKGTMAAALAMIAGVIAIEGGYVKNSADPGGETNMGITKVTAQHNGYFGPMRSLPRSVAESIYYKQYLVAPGYEPLIPLDAAVTEELFDTTVNMGPARPSRWFQESLNALCKSGIVPDGKVGPATIVAFSRCQAAHGSASLCRSMLDSLDGKQLAEYRRVVRVNPRLSIFYKGWIANRIGNVDRRKCVGAPA